jgi:diketogulonate reductase-like aldo/keto reductase
MPALGLGLFQTPPDETQAAVEAALATGYRHIDTAAAYGNEREVGQAVRSSDAARGEVFLETKIWISDYGYDETLHAFEKSAAKLGVNQIELHPYFQEREVQAFDAVHSILTRRSARTFASQEMKHATELAVGVSSAGFKLDRGHRRCLLCIAGV